MLTTLSNSVLGFIIGAVLGLLGGGGSILTVPALVYLAGQTAQGAVTASLMIVGTNSAFGALYHRTQGTMNWRVALTFGGVGMVTAYFAAGLSELFSPGALMVAFALLMLAVGLMMVWRQSHPVDTDVQASKGWLTITLTGAAVGVLTGFLGVGGGFLIVPALVMLVGLPFRQAVGTSLVIIAMNSLAGLLGHLHGMEIDMATVTTFAVAGIVGTMAGTRLAQRIEPKRLQTLFAAFIIALALFLLWDNVTTGL